jgi:hypothetical protein
MDDLYKLLVDQMDEGIYIVDCSLDSVFGMAERSESPATTGMKSWPLVIA